jgi:hydrogenase-4 component B
MTPNEALVYALTVCLAGSIVTLLASRSKALAGWLTFLTILTSSCLVAFSASAVLLGEAQPALTLLEIGGLGPCRLAIDGLSAVFLLLIAVIALLASLYSIRYMDHYPEYGVAVYYPFFLLFVAGMYGIVVVTDLMVYFFGFWQLMTLPSYALVRYEWRKRDNVRAANRYLVMMQISCGLVMLGAYLLGSKLSTASELGRFDFDTLAHGMPALLVANSGLVSWALLLFLVGFGIKAGMWPFGQMWLPAAHPAAPSPVSALLSGVMIKTGVYGLMRSFIWLVPSTALSDYPARNWGFLIATLGTATLLFGTLQALKQEETKRLLAFHSIGQVGYILLGLGASLALLPAASEQPFVLVLAAFGFAGALFHTINHGIFKSLLFLNAGSVLFATGTQNLNRVGGLIRYMPVTAATTLIASFSIAGVPLFNGFASKWTIYVSTILGSQSAGYLAFLAVFAILTSAVTLASFIKFFGTSFLSRTSQLVKEKAEESEGRLEVGTTMIVPQVVLAVLCLGIGLFPRLVIRLLDSALARSEHGLGATLSAGLDSPQTMALTIPGGEALLFPAALALVLAGMLLLARTLSRVGGSSRKKSEPWLCGYAVDAEVNRYRAHGLYGEVKRHLKWTGGTVRPSAPPSSLHSK